MVGSRSSRRSRGRAQRFLLNEGFWLSCSAKVGLIVHLCGSIDAKKLVVAVAVVRLVVGWSE